MLISTGFGSLITLIGIPARLEADMSGGAPTGFDPKHTDAGLEVAFTMCVIEGTVEAQDA